MKKMTSRIISAFIILVMFLQYLPVGISHAEKTDTNNSDTKKVEFVVSPENTDISVIDKDGQEVEPTAENVYIYDLEEGEYSYTASLNSYESIEKEKFNVGKENKLVEVNLNKSDKDYTNLNTITPRASGDALSLDNVTITDFKIIDVTNGNREIEYKKSDAPEYNDFKNDASKFNNAICENQNNADIKLKLSISYSGKGVAVKEGDTLEIPANYGGNVKDFSSLPLTDSEGHVLGTWEYKGGKFLINFSGDYIKNHQVTDFTASFETGNMTNYISGQPKTFVNGEKFVNLGKLGNLDLVVPFEKEFINAKTINNSNPNIFKAGITPTDKSIDWLIMLRSDLFSDTKYSYFNPWLLEHKGQYSPRALSNIYIEDTFEDVIKEPEFLYFNVFVSGISDAGVISGSNAVSVPANKLTKISQSDKTREQVKNELQKGQYCMFNNGDGTYTLMMKWWDMNDGSGLKFDDIPAIQQAGGVGNYLKNRNPKIYETMSPEAVEKINDLYRGMAVQNVDIRVKATYPTVKEQTQKLNTAMVSTKQLTKNPVGRATMTPSAGIADAPANPLTIKLIKTDVKTGANLSDGFKFKLQTSIDGGTVWNDVAVVQGNVEKGTLNADGTLTPANGEIQVKGLIGGQKYRFLETAHADGYQDVAEDNANPNDAKHPTSANSRVVDISNQGKGKVIVMYNEKKNVEKISINVTKVWNGVDGNKPTISLQLMKNNQPEGAPVELTNGKTTHQWTDLPKVDNTGTAFVYTVKEVGEDKGFVTLDNDLYKVTYGGDVQQGFTVTNKKTSPLIPLIPATRDIQVTKEWKLIGTQKPVDKIEVELFKDGVTTGNRLYLNETNNWTAKFTDVLVAELGTGRAYEYTVKEVGENNGEITLNNRTFDVTYSGTMDEGFKVKNQETAPLTPLIPATRDIQVTKEWKLIGTEKPVDKIEVELFKDGVTTGIKLELNETNNWTAKFTNLEMSATIGGKDYEYTVKEVGENNGEITLNNRTFDVTYSGTMDEGFKVKNQETAPLTPLIPATRDIQVTKEWKLIGTEKPVDKIEVELFKDGVATGIKLELNETNNWTAKFTNLEMSSTVGGKDYEYTVKEVGENNNTIKLGNYMYKVKYEGNMEDGFVITNEEEKSQIPPKPDNQNTKPDANKIPKTGVGANVMLYSLMLLISGSMVLLRKRRSR